jgi:hypothetical protein
MVYKKRERKTNMKIDTKIIEQIKKIEWFCNCGKPLSNAIEFEVNYVTSWKQAKKYYQSNDWEDIRLEAKNELTLYLHDNYPSEYKMWNKVVRDTKAILEKDVKQKIEVYRETNSLDNKFVNRVNWDILGFVLEFVYAEYKAPYFYNELFKIYESGNFPCGWDGKYPSGRLMIF